MQLKNLNNKLKLFNACQASTQPFQADSISYEVNFMTINFVLSLKTVVQLLLRLSSIAYERLHGAN